MQGGSVHSQLVNVDLDVEQDVEVMEIHLFVMDNIPVVLAKQQCN